MIGVFRHTMKIAAAMGGEGIPLLPIDALLEVWYGETERAERICPGEA